jgi:arylsulfatase
MKLVSCLLVAVTLAVLSGTHASAEAPASPPPNIMLVMPDDAGYGDYSCFGSPMAKTPAVDAFRAQALLFSQFQVSPTCAPARSAIMSGRHEFKNGVTHTIQERERLSPKTFTLAQLLKSAGYSTGIFGKWHLGDEDAYRPDKRGFDETYIHGAGGIGQTYPGSCGDAPGNSNINPAILHNGKFVKTKGYCTDLFFEQATKWIASRRGAANPFFAFITLNAPHDPHVIPEGYYRHHLGKQGVSEDTARFFGMVENIDMNFGKLLNFLDNAGLATNTLVIYLGSDNGGTAGVKFNNMGLRGAKATAYQGGVRIPAFFRWPGVAQPGAKCEALAAHIDLFPTMMEITGARLPESAKGQVEGRSLMPLIRNPRAAWEDRFLVTHVGRWPNGKVSEAKHTQCSIRNSRFTLVNNRELFDLDADPGEKQNVIERHPEIVERLRAEYDKWWNDVQPLLVNENAKGPEVNPFKELYWRQFPDEKPSAEPVKENENR